MSSVNTHSKARSFASLRMTIEKLRFFAAFRMTPHQITAVAYFVRGKQKMDSRSFDFAQDKFRGNDTDWYRLNPA